MKLELNFREFEVIYKDSSTDRLLLIITEFLPYNVLKIVQGGIGVAILLW